MAQWYALRSKPNKEEFVWRQVTAQGFESFYPYIPVNPVNPRSRKSKPYFPGYLFVHVELSQVGQTTFQWMANGLGLVGFDGSPAPVDDAIINIVRKQVETIANCGGEYLYGLKQGDEVAIKSGPFAGYHAIFDMGLPGKDRVRVLLQLMSERSVPIELEASRVKPRHA
jgi:transcriptional antiterminator RfaH